MNEGMNEPGAPRERLAPPLPEEAPSRRARRAAAREAARRAAGEARPKKRRRGLRFLGRVFGALVALGMLGGIAGGVVAYNAYERYAAELPTLDGLKTYQPRVMSRVYSGDSRLIAELATERRIFIPATAIPSLVKQAFISAEDQRFWTHSGVDPMAVARAIWVDIQQWGQRRPIGASSITQQVAKNMLLGNELSIARKVKEAILAVRIERTLSKDRILELYLNEIYLGLQAYGVAAAAQTYFNKSLDDITLPEAAFLAALPKAPNNYNPFRYPEAAKVRRDWVLDRMAEDRAITAEDAARAKATPIQPSLFRRGETVAGSEWFSEEVRRQLVESLGSEKTTQGGLVIRTSLDPVMQAAADKALRAGLMGYDRSRTGFRGPILRVEAGPQLRTAWADRLGALPRAPGMLPEWRMAVVLEVQGDQALLGWSDPVPGQPMNKGTPRTLPMFLAETGWARPARPNGGYGAAPRRMQDVVQPGDVVMAEPVAAGSGPRGAGRPERLLLRQPPQVQGALVAIEVATGRVLAMSGGWGFDMSQFNRATQAQRQPGSSFKPFVYLTAMEQGLSPSQRVMDSPYVQQLPRGQVWAPGNYGGGSSNAAVPIRVALERSLNLVTVRLAEKVGMEAVAQTAIAFHVVDGMPKVLPASLGAVETTVLRQAAAYAGLAAGGKEVLPTLVDSIQDRDGHLVWKPSSLRCRGCDDPARPPQIQDARRQVADPQSVFQILTMMQGVTTRGTGTAAVAGLNRVVAGKTGTTQDSNDAWFVGATPDIAVAVWLGFDNNTSLGDRETGGGVAAPIFRDFMIVAMKDRPALTFRAPDGVKMLAWESGSGSRTDAFKPGQEPGASEGTIGGGSGGGGEGGDLLAGGGGTGVDSGMGGLY